MVESLWSLGSPEDGGSSFMMTCEDISMPCEWFTTVNRAATYSQGGFRIETTQSWAPKDV